VDSSAKSFKRVGKTERIGFQIFIDMSFNQNVAVRIVRFGQVTQCGRAWPEPMHFSSRNSAVSHDKVINLPCQRCLSSGGLTLIAHRSGFIDLLLDLVEVAPVGVERVVGFFGGAVVVGPSVSSTSPVLE
jgi:hypothetical protein